jgi:hypothetical protein
MVALDAFHKRIERSAENDQAVIAVQPYLLSRLPQ